MPPFISATTRMVSTGFVMGAFIQNSTCRIPEFDNDLVRRLIANIKVISAEKLLVQFQSGIILEQEIRYD